MISTNQKAWLLAGNAGTNPANQFVGTTDNQHLAFRTNNIERMRILNNGNVGIGTNNSGALLHLNRDPWDDLLRLTRENAEWNFRISNPTTDKKLRIRAENSDIMTLQSDGDVGVGTINPDEKLHVNGNLIVERSVFFRGNNQSRIFAGGANRDFIGIRARNSLTDGPGITLYGPDDNEFPPQISFHTQNIRRMVITDDGLVGIGVLEPVFLLDLPNEANVLGRGRANQWVTYSDNRVKSNQAELHYGLNELLKIEPKYYTHHSSTFESGELVLKDGEETFGLIAQELYQIIPEAVSKPLNEAEDLWSIDYIKLTTVLIKAIQEQEQSMNLKANRIDALEEELIKLMNIVHQFAEKK